MASSESPSASKSHVFVNSEEDEESFVCVGVGGGRKKESTIYLFFPFQVVLKGFALYVGTHFMSAFVSNQYTLEALARFWQLAGRDREMAVSILRGRNN